jgi:hypothetical protein
MMAATMSATSQPKVKTTTKFPTSQNGTKFGSAEVFGTVTLFPRNGCKYLEVDTTITIQS